MTKQQKKEARERYLTMKWRLEGLLSYTSGTVLMVESGKKALPFQLLFTRRGDGFLFMAWISTRDPAAIPKSASTLSSVWPIFASSSITIWDDILPKDALSHPERILGTISLFAEYMGIPRKSQRMRFLSGKPFRWTGTLPENDAVAHLMRWQNTPIIQELREKSVNGFHRPSPA